MESILKPAMNRRQFCSLSMVTALKLIEPKVACAKSTIPQEEDPWSIIQNPSRIHDDIQALLLHAVVAPSPVNNQPWKFRVAEAGIEVHRDPSRDLPVIMPDHKYLYISLGAAAENMIIAARHLGHEVHTEYLPNGENSDPAIIVRLDEKTGPNQSTPLFNAIRIRHTNRKIYDGRPLGRDIFHTLNNLIDEEGFRLNILEDRSTIEKIAGMVGDAIKRQFDDHESYQELYEWIRFSDDEIIRRRDGQPIDSFNMNWMERGVAAVGMKPTVVRFLCNIGFASMYSGSYQKVAKSASALCLLSTKTPSQRNLLKAGRLYERMILTLTSMGVAFQPLMTLMEVKEFKEEMKNIYSLNDNEPVMHFRIGIPTKPAVTSPRRPLSEVLL